MWMNAQRLMKFAGLTVVLLFAWRGVVEAGDAVAIGYNANGVWTSVIYYCSSTPKGGADYKNEADARAAAVRDLEKKARAEDGMVRTEILSSSDRTGYVVYARGKIQAGKQDVHAVGYGASKEEAERQAFAQLDREGAKRAQQVIYTYFSHGAAAPARSAKK